MVTIKCTSCGHENVFEQPYPYHAGFSNQGFLYNDDGNLTLVWSSFDPAYRAVVGKKHPWALTAEERAQFESSGDEAESISLPKMIAYPWRTCGRGDTEACVAAINAIVAQTVAAIRAVIARSAIPLVSLEAMKDLSTEARFALLASLAAALETRKIVFLSRRPGLVPNAGPVLPVVSLATDTPRLLAPGTLPRGQAMLLRQVKQVVETVPQRLSVTVVNPLQLLRELFTVNGAGTLIRRGSRIDVYEKWEGIDRPRIEALFASAFERPVRADFFAQLLARIYVEENYSGAAVMQESPVAPYLTKFAVERQAQGEGIGGELWSVVARDFPTFFWRSRPANPITSWYIKQCDGFARFPEWLVFWRGLAPEAIEPAIRYALALPTDFG
jgi:ribosomal protein S18 acetylase RimI-like enzyme